MTKRKNIYFWLKLDQNFFKNLAIKQAMRMPGGKDMIIIYQILMLESMTTNGILYYEGTLPTIEKELSIKLDIKEEDLQMTLAYFKSVGLIQIDDYNNAEMLQVPALIAQETDWARYKRNQREQQKLDNVQQLSNDCPIDIDKDIDKEISNHILSINNKREIYQHFEKMAGRTISPLQMEKFEQELDKLQPSVELVKLAIDEAVGTNDSKKMNLAYICGIVKNWGMRGWTTVEIVQQAKQEYLDSQEVPKVEPSDDFMNAMNLWKE